MDIRQRILEAAARVYSQHGFRGATTRLIATEAGVNEVTLFRNFGSKEALFEELMRGYPGPQPPNELPELIDDPERELTEWVTARLTQLRESAWLLRKTIGELEERRAAAVSACRGSSKSRHVISAYVERMRRQGLLDPDADVRTAVTMLLSTCFSDAMCRDIVPESFPEPERAAPRKYVRAFLRAVGARIEASRPAPSRRAVH